MDGNGRWAQAKGLPRVKGHEEGAQNVRRIMKAAKQAGVKYLTLYAFSVENWNRPKLEVEALMRLLKRFLTDYEQEFHDNKIRLRIMGRKSDLPEKILKEIERVEVATSAYEDYTLIIALSYGGRVEIVNAAKKLAEKVQAGELNASDIDEKSFASELYLPNVPDPDLIIRTSGEFRVSNFLLWQCAYSEFYITPICWPEFDEGELEKALAAFVDSVSAELKEGGKVQLIGFGTFETRERAARTGINPQTKQTIKIAASKSPVFKAGAALKAAIK